MDHPQPQQDELYALSLLEEAIDFALYRVAVDPHNPYGGKVVMVSPSIKAIAGIQDPERFETWFMHLHPDDLPQVIAANQRAWQEQVVYDQIARFYNVVKGQWVWLHTISTPITNAEGVLTHFTGVILDITQQKQAELELQYRAAFENLILSLSTRFINLGPNEIDLAIDSALQAIGEFTGVDRAYLLAFSPDQQTMAYTHEWRRAGIPQPVIYGQDIPASQYSWAVGKLLRGEVLHAPRLAELPPEAQPKQAVFAAHGVRSWLAVPMVSQRKVLGLLGFEAVQAEKTWSPDSMGLLQVVGNIFVHALEHKRAQESLQRAHEELEQRVIERTQELHQANQALHHEVAQRKQVEETLRISQALYSEVFDNSPLQIFVLDVLPDGRFRVLRTNPAHQETAGLPPEKIWGKTVEELLVPEVARTINQHYRDCIQAGGPIEYEEQGPAPYWNLERIRTFRTTLAPVYNSQGKVVRLIGASQDITEQKQAEQIVMDRTREEAVSAERSRLARELHDAVTQTLFSTMLTAEVLPKIWERDPQEGRKKMEELRELTRGALAEMRTLLMELRPETLVDAPLKDLLQHLGNAFIARARVPLAISIASSPDLPVDVKVAFYRVAQEALNNITKHSDATQVRLSFERVSDSIALIVSDNGQGFDLGETVGADHCGLRFMRERAEQVGARLEIESGAGRGTHIAMVWPAETIGREE